MGAHAHTHYRYLCNFAVAGDLPCANFICYLIEHLFRTGQIIASDSKGEIDCTVVANVLHDHVHFDIGFTNWTQNLIRHTRHIRCALDG